MSDKEIVRGQIVGQLVEGTMDLKEAAKRLAISARQVKRLKRRYLKEGIAGLISKRRGRAPNNCLAPSVLTRAVELIGTHYIDFGPTFAAEKLVERHAIKLSVETVRKQMIAAGYWKPRRGNAVRTHPMRERRARLGELIQIDGSPHDWFEGRSDPCTLLVFIDDATSKLTQLRFVPTETTLGYMQVLHDHIVTHGLPVALYSDKHSIFRLNATGADPEAQTQFSRAARELGIECIHAHSPQAKGRVERANQTLQDRLVKEMRLAGINDRESANAWLPDFVVDFNRRFGVIPQDLHDAHVPYQGTHDALTRILSVQMVRTLSKNLSCQYENKLLQVQTSGTGLGIRGAKITLHEHFDGRCQMFWKHRKLNYTVMDKPLRQAPTAEGKTLNTRVDQAIIRRNTGHKPASNHPGRHMPISSPARDGLVTTVL